MAETAETGTTKKALAVWYKESVNGAIDVKVVDRSETSSQVLFTTFKSRERPRTTLEHLGTA